MSEVVREGLRLLMDREDAKAASIAYLKRALEQGLSDFEEGRVYDGAGVFNELKAKGLERAFLRLRATST